MAEATEEAHLIRGFGIWGVISISWNMVNIFGGMSTIFLVGFSAGGIPSIFYGFVGSSICVGCIILILAECASVFPTAGGAYHFSTFIAPAKYRRYIGYPLGWLNYLGWVFTIAACSAIGVNLAFSLANLCDSSVVVTTRWRLFLVYCVWATAAWVFNAFLLRATDWLEKSGCCVSMLGFVGFCVALLVKAPKASTAFVFQDVINRTGYQSDSMAVLLGLFNSMVAWVCLDAACHLAEEVPHPAVLIPKILYITLGTQFFVGIIYILSIGFSIKNIQVIIDTPTGVPIIELVRQGLNSNSAAIVFNIVLICNYFCATTGAMIASSRQGFALARDGGLFFKNGLTRIKPPFMVPFHSVNLCYALTILIGIVYLFSTQGFQAILGTEGAFMVLSYAAPSLMMLIFGRSALKKTPFSLGRFGYPCAIVSVTYASLLTILVVIPQVHPVTPVSMNYTIVLMGIFSVLCLSMWFLDARKSYLPPSFQEFVDGVAPPQDRDEFLGVSKDLS